jgi:hypothetical protein
MASSFTTASARIFSHVPSSVHFRNHSWAVFRGSYRSGRSRLGAPVRSLNTIALLPLPVVPPLTTAS